MKLVLHQLRHECLHHRWLLLAFFAALVTQLLLSVGLIVPENFSFAATRAHQRLQTVVSIALALLFFLLVLAPIFADPPARLDRHLSTRPLAPRSLFAGKALFILTLLILPIVGVEFAAVLILKQGLIVASWAALDRLLLLTPLAFLVASFASHFRSPLLCFLGALATALLLNSGLFILTKFFEATSFRLNIPPSIPALGISYIAVGTFLALASCSFSRKEPPLKKRFMLHFWSFGLGLILVALLSHLQLTLPSKHQKPLEALFQNPDQAPHFNGIIPNNAQQELEPLKLTFSPETIAQVFTQHPQASFTHRFSLFRISDSSSTRFESVADPSEAPLFAGVELPNRTLSQGLQNTLKKEFPNLRAIIPNHRMIKATSVQPADANRFPHLHIQDQVSVEGTVETFIGKWKLEANLPFRPEDRPQSNGFQLQFSNILFNKIGDLEIYLTFTQVEGSLLQNHHHEYLENLQVGLYFPTLNIIEFGDVSYRKENRSLSVVTKNQITIGFSSFRNYNLKENLAHETRLVVLGVRPLAKIETPYSKESAYPPREVLSGEKVNLPLNNLHSNGQLVQWIRQNPHNPQASKGEVSREIESLIFLAESTSHWPKSEGPVARRLAIYTPQHLPLLINYLRDGYQVEANPSLTKLILQALTLGVDPSQREALVTAAQKYPILMEVLIARGWLVEGEGVFRHHLESSPASQSLALRALLALDNPENDPLILETFLKEPTTPHFELIRRIPRLRRSLQGRSDEIWPDTIFTFHHDQLPPLLEMALALGNRRALQDLFYIVERTRMERWGRAQPLYWPISTFFHLPKLIKLNESRSSDRPPIAEFEFYSWFPEHQPEDFAFDPVRQLFVLKNSTSP